MQTLDLIASAPKLADLKIWDDFACSLIFRWPRALLGVVPGSLQSMSLRICLEEGHIEQGVVREAGEGTAAMLGRLAALVE